MQQLALQRPISYEYPVKMSAVERDARDPNHPTGGGEFPFFGDNGLDIGDVVDAINPLQHIPGISSLYREASGDSISPIVSIAGGAILGGPVGMALSAANALFEAISGDSVIGHVASLFDAPASTATLAKANRAYLKAGQLV